MTNDRDPETVMILKPVTRENSDHKSVTNISVILVFDKIFHWRLT
jgi:hypothetical protein